MKLHLKKCFHLLEDVTCELSGVGGQNPAVSRMRQKNILLKTELPTHFASTMSEELKEASSLGSQVSQVYLEKAQGSEVKSPTLEEEVSTNGEHANQESAFEEALECEKSNMAVANMAVAELPWFGSVRPPTDTRDGEVQFRRGSGALVLRIPVVREKEHQRKMRVPPFSAVSLHDAAINVEGRVEPGRIKALLLEKGLRTLAESGGSDAQKLLFLRSSSLQGKAKRQRAFS